VSTLAERQAEPEVTRDIAEALAHLYPEIDRMDEAGLLEGLMMELRPMVGDWMRRARE
jgi:hypothetical protein